MRKSSFKTAWSSLGEPNLDVAVEGHIDGVVKNTQMPQSFKKKITKQSLLLSQRGISLSRSHTEVMKSGVISARKEFSQCHANYGLGASSMDRTNESTGLYADHRPVVQGESSVTSSEAWRSRSLRACDPLSASAGYHHLQ